MIGRSALHAVAVGRAQRQRGRNLEGTGHKCRLPCFVLTNNVTPNFTSGRSHYIEQMHFNSYMWCRHHVVDFLLLLLIGSVRISSILFETIVTSLYGSLGVETAISLFVQVASVTCPWDAVLVRVGCRETVQTSAVLPRLTVNVNRTITIQ